jgi:hypothetical protein
LAKTLTDTFGHIGVGEAEEAYVVLTTDPGQSSAGLVFGLLSALLFHHKTRKAHFRLVFCGTFVVNCALLVLVVTAVG